MGPTPSKYRGPAPTPLDDCLAYVNPCSPSPRSWNDAPPPPASCLVSAPAIADRHWAIAPASWSLGRLLAFCLPETWRLPFAGLRVDAVSPSRRQSPPMDCGSVLLLPAVPASAWLLPCLILN
jgi:hypothetical protein